jgi:hypothetical protein
MAYNTHMSRVWIVSILFIFIFLGEKTMEYELYFWKNFLFSLFPHSPSENDFDRFQCSIHAQKVSQLYSPSFTIIFPYLQ